MEGEKYVLNQFLGPWNISNHTRNTSARNLPANQTTVFDGTLTKRGYGNSDSFYYNTNPYSSICVLINFFLSLDANIFIGTEVSSYSTSVVNSRFYRNDNYSDGGMKGEQKDKSAADDDNKKEIKNEKDISPKVIAIKQFVINRNNIINY